MPRRIARFHEGNITPDMQALFERTTQRIKSKRDTSPAMKALLDERGLNGPPSLWLLSSGVGHVFEAMQDAIRTTISLSPRRTEIVVLLVGHHCRSEFEIFAHKLAAQAVGLSDSEVAALLSDADPGFTDPVDALIAELARTLLTTGDLEDGLFDRAVCHIGNHGVFEVTVLVGFYQAIALQLQVFRVTSE